MSSVTCRPSQVDHQQICRAVSLGEDSNKCQVQDRRTELSNLSHKRDSLDLDDDLFIPDEDFNRLPPVPRPVKQSDILICRKVHGYSWNDLWNGMSRGSFKLRTGATSEHKSVPDYC